MKQTKRTLPINGIKGFLILVVLVSVWILLSYQNHMKFLNWQQLAKSGQYEAIKVQLESITEQSSPSGGTNPGGSHRQDVQVVGFLSDVDGKKHQVNIESSRLSKIKINEHYDLYNIDGVEFVPAFTEKVNKTYELSMFEFILIALLVLYLVVLLVITTLRKCYYVE